MNDDIETLLARMRDIEAELERRFDARRAMFHYEVRKRKAVFEAAAAARHREFRTGILRFLRDSTLLSIATAPLVYALVLPLALLDLCVCLFQRVCFPVWGVARVPRLEFFVIDHQYLPYLNAIQKLNCVYCSYANGLVSFIQEVAARTETFWCPIKHARRIRKPHHRCRQFLDYGDAEGFREKLDELRRTVAEKD